MSRGCDNSRPNFHNDDSTEVSLAMATVVLLGSDVALLEGVAQTLATAGHRPALTRTPSDVCELASSCPPLVLIVEREFGAEAARVPLAPGGALLLYRSADEPDAPLPAAVRRATLAELTLPLERHRLLALVGYVEERAARTGRARVPTPPEHRAF
jgi:hypothetical protein